MSWLKVHILSPSQYCDTGFGTMKPSGIDLRLTHSAMHCLVFAFRQPSGTDMSPHMAMNGFRQLSGGEKSSHSAVNCLSFNRVLRTCHHTTRLCTTSGLFFPMLSSRRSQWASNLVLGFWNQNNCTIYVSTETKCDSSMKQTKLPK